MQRDTGLLYRFENFALDSDRHELCRDGALVQLEPQVFELLVFLVENRHRIVRRDDLLDSIWGGRIVSDSALATRINAARRAIGDSGKEQRLIRTTIGRGFRFIGVIQPSIAEASEPAPPNAVSGDPTIWSANLAAPKPSTPSRYVILVACLTVLICLGLVASFTWPQTRPRMSIVVLPLTNLSNDSGQEYFVDAITNDLTTDLSRIANSFVIARTTAFTYKGKPVNAQRIGHDLNVRYVLEGSVQQLNEQVQVNVQLIDAATGAHIWADRFDTDRSNLAKTQDEITGRLARTLKIELIQAVGRKIEEEKSTNLDARDLVMLGWAAYSKPVTPDTALEALGLFEKALKLDPASADAKTGAAELLVQNTIKGWSKSPKEDQARAEKLLTEALEYNNNNAEAHFVMGQVRHRYQHRLPEAQIELERALALDPVSTGTMLELGYTLMGLGEPVAALPYFEKSLSLSLKTQNLAYQYTALGFCHLALSGNDQAIDYFRKARAANQKLWYVHLGLAAALGLKGDIDEAKDTLAESIKLRPDFDSLSKVRRGLFDESPRGEEVREKTLYAGLRLAGLPEQ